METSRSGTESIIDKRFKAYVDYMESLSLSNLSELSNFVSEDIHFKDPFNEFKSAIRLEELFKVMFRRLKGVHFKVTDAAPSGSGLYVNWNFHFRSRLVKYGRSHTIQGMSYLELNDDGKIAKHIDYWDAYSALFVHLSGVGIFFRAIGRFFA